VRDLRPPSDSVRGWPCLRAMDTRNSAVAAKPRDVYVQMQRRGWPPKTPPPNVYYHAQFGRSTLNSVVIDKGEPPKLGTRERWSSAPLGRRSGWPPENKPLPVCHHVKFGSSASKGVPINRRKPQNWGALGPPPCGGGMAEHVEIHPSPHALSCRILSF